VGSAGHTTSLPSMGRRRGAFKERMSCHDSERRRGGREAGRRRGLRLQAFSLLCSFPAFSLSHRDAAVLESAPFRRVLAVSPPPLTPRLSRRTQQAKEVAHRCGRRPGGDEGEDPPRPPAASIGWWEAPRGGTEGSVPHAWWGPTVRSKWSSVRNCDHRGLEAYIPTTIESAILPERLPPVHIQGGRGAPPRFRAPPRGSTM